MRLIGLAVILTVTLTLGPLAVEAQKTVKHPRIGILSASSPPSEPGWPPQRSPFWQAMRELGWIEGQSIMVERRWAEQRPDRLPALAAELVQLKVDLILVTGGGETLAAKRATKTIPIVMLTSLDAVEQGYVASLARPGANVTGVTSMTSELSRKRLELLTEAAPKISRIAILQCKGIRVAQGLEGTLAAATTLGVHPQLLEVREADDYETAFVAAIRARAGAIVVFDCYFNAWNRPRIVALATKHRLPAMYNERRWVDAGGLMSYGPSLPHMHQLAATYVDKILKGAKPADLPVLQPTKLDLVINLKTAKALGLTIPPSLLGRADQVIE
jgi:putative tryptophan/tyrosine transport system substrate-binding protein